MSAERFDFGCWSGPRDSEVGWGGVSDWDLITEWLNRVLTDPERAVTSKEERGGR